VAEQVERRRAVAGLGDRIAFGFEQIDERFAQILVVVDDEDRTCAVIRQHSWDHQSVVHKHRMAGRKPKLDQSTTWRDSGQFGLATTLDSER
jgi:hypothetical protein